MRYGVLADIHANLHALEAALAALRREDVDAYLCSGDLVGYGAFPNECVERIAELGAVCVAGNHDLIALGRLPDDQCIPLARESLRWTRDLLRDGSREYLELLPIKTRVGDEILLAHGSIDDPRCYVTKPEQAAEQLRQLPHGVSTLILGHTHKARCHRADGEQLPTEQPVTLEAPVLLNPGSVGQSREKLARARFMILDLEKQQATWHSVPYDVRACQEALRRRGRPASSCHLYPSLVSRAAGRLKHAARRVLTARLGSGR